MNLKSTPFNLDDQAIRWVEDNFQALSLDEKVGQVFVFNVGLLDFKKKQKNILSFKPGGVFLFTTTAGIQRKRATFLQRNSAIPLFSSIHGNHSVVRPIPGATPFQSQTYCQTTYLL